MSVVASTPAGSASGMSMATGATPNWWDDWESNTLPKESNVTALREMWGRTGGRLSKWKEQTGWKPPPPMMSPTDVPKDETAREKLARLYGSELQYKPAFGALWREGHLAKLELPRNGLVGNLPPQLEALTRCRVICLFGNRLDGNMDGTKLPTSLVHLDLSRNKIDGPVPPEISRLKNLQRLHLQFNKISGTLPDVWDKLEDLREVTCQGNRLTGEIPPSFGGCKELRKLFLHENLKLCGRVPPSFAKCTNLKQLLLAETLIEAGSEPPELLEIGADVQISPPKEDD